MPELAPLAEEIITASAAKPVGERTGELSRRAEALVAEYSGPLPAGDAGLIEAERRRRELAAGEKALYREFEISMKAEEQIIQPIVHTCDDELWRFTNEAMPEGLVGVAVKLRSLFLDEIDDPDGPLAQCLAVLERAIAPREGTGQ